ncbi:unnamed protein product [Sphagnum jensenii]|uniref:Uncharacterized protein n=1 Tax=Sphagnum jensenii TaxID=128206 RepID=A0ABP0WBT0_9BRYO
MGPKKEEQLEENPLQKQVEEQAEEIIKLREVLAIIGSGEGDLRETKILDLFKKVYVSNYDMIFMSCRFNTLCLQLMSMHNVFNSVKGRDDNPIQESLDYWVDKYQRTNKKLLEVQANETMLEKQIQKLNHIIQREVGDHIPLQKVIEDGSGWVGRSEQVSLLKDKVAELKAQVAALQPAPISGYNTIKNDERRAVEILHRNQLEAMDVDRRLQYDKLVHDFLALRASWGMQKKRLDGVIARRNILEKELTGARQKMGMLLSKSTNDDLLIQALTIELATVKQQIGPPYPKPGGPLQLDHHIRCDRLAASFNDLKEQCHEQSFQIKSQEEIIQMYHDTIDNQDCEDWCTATLFQESYASSESRLPTPEEKS